MVEERDREIESLLLHASRFGKEMDGLKEEGKREKEECKRETEALRKQCVLLDQKWRAVKAQAAAVPAPSAAPISLTPEKKREAAVKAAAQERKVRTDLERQLDEMRASNRELLERLKDVNDSSPVKTGSPLSPVMDEVRSGKEQRGAKDESWRE